MRQRHSFNTTHDLFLKLLRSSQDKYDIGRSQNLSLEKIKSQSQKILFGEGLFDRKSFQTLRKPKKQNIMSQSLRNIKNTDQTLSNICTRPKHKNLQQMVKSHKKSKAQNILQQQANKSQQMIKYKKSKINIKIENVYMPLSIQKKKFIDEFNSISSQMNHQNHIHLNLECFLDQNSLSFILSKMNYLTNDDEQVVQQLWRDLGGVEYGGFLRQNLCTVLQIVQGYYQKQKLKVDNEAQLLKMSQQLKLQISSNYFEHISKKYKFLKQNRRRNRRKQKQLDPKLQIQYRLKPDLIQQIQNINYKTKQSNSKIKRVQNELRPNTKKQSIESFSQIRNSQKVIARMRKGEQERRRRINKLSLNKQNHFDHNKNMKIYQTKTSQKGRRPHKQNTPNQITHEYLPKSIIMIKSLKKIPLLSVDVNLEEGKMQKIIVYEGDTAKDISLKLAEKHKLDQQTRIRFQNILSNHISGFLTRIQQLQQQASSEFND